ncbi:hypothetical protein C4B60_10690 [Jeotgalibacillus proteolyticus]|uniref:Uncharacterized protein n=2 Tax=Jeotgalibacillus proteolyticus TaxID=2082395 RepID=A0A2S5GC58_9BACL|nr:hypothetical protein C4B60_10690 [Jeotgalibacillus proteolyticus]
MRKEADRLTSLIWGSSESYKSWGVAQYGLEAAMPKGQSIRSAAEMDAMDARDLRLYNRFQKFDEHVNAVESIANFVEKTFDDRYAVILDCMMEGMSYRSIAMHLGVNRNTIGEMKNKMLNEVCQKCHFLQELQSWKKTS